MDGVLYRGRQPVPGVAQFFAWVGARGHSYALVTNNSSRTPEEITGQLAGMGLQIPPDRIVTSAVGTAQWLRARAPQGARVQAIGGPGLLRALFAPGSPLTPDWIAPEWVVVGLDTDVTYRKLADACLAVQRGARFIATNPDASYPTEDGLTPGAGALQGVITAVTGAEPRVIGKPEGALFETALQGMPTEGDIVVVGDRLDTDILAGIRIGATTALVLTGVSTREEAEQGAIRPDLICADLTELTARLDARAAGSTD
jgi:4-nitrophenyl phosphatase